MIKRALDFGYIKWPSEIARYVTGKDVLDVGCGCGLHSTRYVLVGVKSYTGIDQLLKLKWEKVKNLRSNQKDNFGWTVHRVMEEHSRVTLERGSFEDLSIEKSFDIAILHNVTEHLMNIPEVFRGVWEKLRTGGLILYYHHNFYCWNGHHQIPKLTEQIDPDDPKQKNFIDWAHLTFEVPPNHYTVTKLNRIRLDDLKILTEKYFHIDTWVEKPIDEERGAERLTDEIRMRNSCYTERELTTQAAFCLGRKREVIEE